MSKKGAQKAELQRCDKQLGEWCDVEEMGFGERGKKTGEGEAGKDKRRRNAEGKNREIAVCTVSGLEPLSSGMGKGHRDESRKEQLADPLLLTEVSRNAVCSAGSGTAFSLHRPAHGSQPRTRA